MKTLNALILSICLLLSACSSASQSLVITGETLKGLGNEFVQVATIYKQGCDESKTIKPEDCQRFRSFGQQFQKSYPLAVQLWEAARSASDLNTQKKVNELITQLTADLSAFAVSVISTHSAGGK